jgi:hypothetical protein
MKGITEVEFTPEIHRNPWMQSLQTQGAELWGKNFYRDVPYRVLGFHEMMAKAKGSTEVKWTLVDSLYLGLVSYKPGRK